MYVLFLLIIDCGVISFEDILESYQSYKSEMMSAYEDDSFAFVEQLTTVNESLHIRELECQAQLDTLLTNIKTVSAMIIYYL